MLPGFLHRLLAEIRLLVEKPKYRDTLATKSFRMHSPPSKPNCTAWLGGQTWGWWWWVGGERREGVFTLSECSF